jgi:hypothetical protein
MDVKTDVIRDWIVRLDYVVGRSVSNKITFRLSTMMDSMSTHGNDPLLLIVHCEVFIRLKQSKDNERGRQIGIKCSYFASSWH